MENQVIHEFEKNANEKVQIQFNNYMGRDLIDIRVFFSTDEDKHQWIPTKKGITMSVNLLPELLEGLSKANEKLQG